MGHILNVGVVVHDHSKDVSARVLPCAQGRCNHVGRLVHLPVDLALFSPWVALLALLLRLGDCVLPFRALAGCAPSVAARWLL